MITLDAFLVFLGAASLPIIYLLIVSRWVGPEYRRSYPAAPVREPKPAQKRELTRQAA